MSEHNLKLSEEIRNRIRAKYHRLKNFRPSEGVLFWNSGEKGTYNVGRNTAKRAKKNDSTRTH